MKYDVAVIGLGGIGSAILAHCARRGASVIGIEQFAAGHEMGSSTGKSRMIRTAYFEDPAYVPLVRRAFELWRELEQESGEELLRVTGVISVGPEGSEIIEGTRRAARDHGLAVDSLGREETMRRYPALRLRADEVAIFEREAGVVRPEQAVVAHLKVAAAARAATVCECAMTGWRRSGDGFEVSLRDGTRLASAKLVLALGPWFKEMLASVGVNLRVQRNVQAWFGPTTRAYAAPDFPAFLLNRDGLPAPLYGFPDFGEGVKVAFHGHGALTDAGHVEREIDHAADIAPIVAAMEEWMPGAALSFREAKACMYSLTPDEHFVVDRHPQHDNLILCGGFSGHGFKFAPVIGEIAADLALEGGTRHPIEFLSLRRFENG